MMRHFFRLVSLLLFVVKLAALTEEVAYALQSGIIPPTNIHMNVELIVELIGLHKLTYKFNDRLISSTWASNLWRNFELKFNQRCKLSPSINH